MPDLPLRPNPGPELLPPEPPVLAYLAIAFTALVLAAMLLCVARCLRRSRNDPVRSPAQLARRQLEELRTLLGEARIAPGEAIESLARVLRRFLHQQYLLPAEEQTTQEFRQALADAKVLTDEQKADVLAVLERADLVKFACVPVTAEECIVCIDKVASRLERAGDSGSPAR